MRRGAWWVKQHSYTGVWSMLAGFAVFVAWTAGQGGALMPEAGGSGPGHTGPGGMPSASSGTSAPGTSPATAAGGTPGSSGAPASTSPGAIPGIQGGAGVQQVGLPLPGTTATSGNPSPPAAPTSPTGPTTGPTRPGAPSSTRPTPSPAASTHAALTVLADVGVVATDAAKVVVIVATGTL